MTEQEKREQVIIELSDCIEILRDIDSSDCSKGDRENLHGSISSAIQDALDLLKGQKQTLEEVAENYGLTPDGVSFALDQYQKVICEITHSRMSKLSYYADDILRVANEVGCDYCEIKEAQEPRVMTLEEWETSNEPQDGESMCYEVKSQDGTTFLIAMLVKAYKALGHLYGKVFRVWTHRPTDAQREATQWE